MSKTLIRDVKKDLIGKYVCLVQNENTEEQRLEYLTIEDVLFLVNEPKAVIKYQVDGEDKYWTVFLYQLAVLSEDPLKLDRLHRRARKVGRGKA